MNQSKNIKNKDTLKIDNVKIRSTELADLLEMETDNKLSSENQRDRSVEFHSEKAWLGLGNIIQTLFYNAMPSYFTPIFKRKFPS